ncbi:MAG: protein-disulfide reductase DsbD [Rhodocyclales bacterium]|nr:protein-disulfide reductase DsbD [Rhodocyclales bacterium]
MRRFLTTTLALLACMAGVLATFPAWADPVEPERAYQFSARMLNAQTIEATYKIRKDYYLYDNKLRFSATPETVTLGTSERPPGKIYKDEFFGETTIHRGTISILIPVTAAPGLTRFTLTAQSQGCWDGGICYPPLTHTAELAIAAPAAGGAIERSAAPPASGNGAIASGGDESGRIARLLKGSGPLLVLASFFGFGLLLAFTPCTFPMIPILSGIIIGHGHNITRTRSLVLSGAYVMGMAVTYAIAGVAAGMSGTLLSAALQNAWVLGAFALLFVALSLSMFGFYELQMPSALQSRLSSTASHQHGGSLGGVIVMGVLSALIVGPCVAAPLAGALLYIAQTGDAAFGGLALFVMALGMGAPLMAVGVGTRSMLPKVGPWMEGVKKAFGVMLLAVAIWMLNPVVPALWSMLAWAALLLFSAIFLHALDPLPSHAKGWQRFWKGVGVVLLIGGAAMLIGALAGSRDPLQPLAVLRGGSAAEVAPPHFENVRSVAELDARIKTADRPVMLDFYADWCVSCKEMERFTFSDPEVAARMGRMLLLKADVTENNDADKALLKRFNLFGPPGIIFFDARGRERDDLRVVGFMPSAEFGAILDRALR